MPIKRRAYIRPCLLCFCLLNIVFLAIADNADRDANPYRSIWERNAFDLKPAATATDTTPLATVAPRNVQLTGITTIFGNKRALFMVQESEGPGKPAAKPVSRMMTEGETQGGLEVLKIDLKAGSVTLRNDGVVSTVALETNRPASGSGMAPQNVANQGVPHTRGFVAQGSPGVFGNSMAAQNNGYTAALQPRYAQQMYPGGIQIGYTAPPQETSPAPSPGNAVESSPSVPPDAAAASEPPTPGHMGAPQVPPEIEAAILAAEEAVRQGQVRPPPLPAGVVDPAAAAAARAGAPPPPNFPTPPPLPTGFGGFGKQ